MPKSKKNSTQASQVIDEIDRRDPQFVKRVAPFLKGLYDHYFRCEITGWENLPRQTDAKALFIGNHNGLLTFEVLMLFWAWYQRFGFSKKILGLAHGVALDNPFFKWLIPRLGAIPASPENALEALNRGYSLMAYPGGEKESFRPYSERARVDFYGRKGFLKLAIKARVPIVPIVSVGAHESYIILDRGEGIAKALGLYDRFRLHGVPVTYRSLFFMWCLVSGLVTIFPLLLVPSAFAAIFVPLPAKMTFHVLEPIDVFALQDPALTEEENIQRAYDLVVSRMQQVMTEEYAKRKYPIIG